MVFNDSYEGCNALHIAAMLGQTRSLILRGLESRFVICQNQMWIGNEPILCWVYRYCKSRKEFAKLCWMRRPSSMPMLSLTWTPDRGACAADPALSQHEQSQGARVPLYGMASRGFSGNLGAKYAIYGYLDPLGVGVRSLESACCDQKAQASLLNPYIPGGVVRGASDALLPGSGSMPLLWESRLH